MFTLFTIWTLIFVATNYISLNLSVLAHFRSSLCSWPEKLENERRICVHDWQLPAHIHSPSVSPNLLTVRGYAVNWKGDRKEAKRDIYMFPITNKWLEVVS